LRYTGREIDRVEIQTEAEEIMAAPKTRPELLREIGKLDDTINQLVDQMPTSRIHEVQPFPFGSWVLAGAGVALYLNADGRLGKRLDPKLYDFRVLILIAATCLGILAVYYSIRSLFSRKGKSIAANRKLTAQVESLQRQRNNLRSRLADLGDPPR
jgi:hypothetical protein